MKLGELIVEAQRQESLIELRPVKSSETISKKKDQSGRATGVLKPIISITMLGVVIAVLTLNYDLSEILSDLHQLSLSTIAAIFAALIANVLAATLRFKTIAADIGHSISFRRAMATVTTSTLAGALFFQIAGQLIARGIVMGRAGMPFANVVVITAYERIISAVFSGLLGLAGAYYIFGVVYLDQSAGGAEFIKISFGLIAATTVGALFGYGRLAAQSIAPLLTQRFAQRCLRVIGLTVLVQIPTMVAYVTASKALSTDIVTASLVAASAVVMFAASVPISFAGWGVREMSAIAALGTIGVPGHAAFTTAVLIGIGSLLATGIVAVLSLPGATKASREVTAADTRPIDYSRTVSWFLPLAAATLVLFQVHVPVGSGLLNANLADPVALVGGALFVLTAVKQGSRPKWRVSYVNAAVAVATIALAGALLIGGWQFGWTTWAWVNRFLGWFVLLGYATTGALVVVEDGLDALRIVLLTFVGATAAIAGLEVSLVLLREAGAQFASQPLTHGPIEGFAQNRNSFALQLLMATPAIIIFVRGGSLRIALLALMFSAFWFAGSRSGWIAIAALIGIALHIRATTIREVLGAASCAACVALIAIILHVLSVQGSSSAIHNSGDLLSSMPAVIPTQASTQERLVSLVGGLNLFVANPIFGAGLGAFQNLKILTSEGFPLVIHSTPLWLLAELGIVGFLAFTIPALYVFVTEWRCARKDQASAVLILCFVAFAVMSLPADMLYQRTFWLVVGAALAAPPLISRGHFAR
ncbi:MAG TPA: lysylphosphatidylglycerol synthase domain-containing protein [Pseudolabrys sp.]|nr:lysylphosphatidylglycerol synthase domain-containing protein [Pseudolabrys sp.]